MFIIIIRIIKKLQRVIYKGKCILNLPRKVIIAMGNVEHALGDYKILD